MQIAHRPDRMIIIIPSLRGPRARRIANEAVRLARRQMPKLTGFGASRLVPLYGKGYVGVYFPDSYTWFQEHGIRPFTMWALEGRTVPMWIDDIDGTERQRNPKAQIRVTLSGKTQVRIFRKAKGVGQPGRIGVREAARPWTTRGRTGGQIARGNVGVRWRHPGLAPRRFINFALATAAQKNGILPTRIYAADRYWRARF